MVATSYILYEHEVSVAWSSPEFDCLYCVVFHFFKVGMMACVASRLTLATFADCCIDVRVSRIATASTPVPLQRERGATLLVQRAAPFRGSRLRPRTELSASTCAPSSRCNGGTCRTTCSLVSSSDSRLGWPDNVLFPSVPPPSIPADRIAAANSVAFRIPAAPARSLRPAFR